MLDLILSLLQNQYGLMFLAILGYFSYNKLSSMFEKFKINRVFKKADTEAGKLSSDLDTNEDRIAAILKDLDNVSETKELDKSTKSAVESIIEEHIEMKDQIDKDSLIKKLKEMENDSNTFS